MVEPRGARSHRPGLRAGSTRSVNGGRQPAPLLGGHAACRRLPGGGGLRPCVALCRRLGLLAAIIEEMAGGVAGSADRFSPLASRQRDPPLQDGAGRSRRDGCACWKRSSSSISRSHPDAARLRRAAHDRLGRAFLNRAHDAPSRGASRTGSRRLAQGFPTLAALDQDDRRRPQAVRPDGGSGRRPAARMPDVRASERMSAGDRRVLRCDCGGQSMAFATGVFIWSTRQSVEFSPVHESLRLHP